MKKQNKTIKQYIKPETFANQGVIYDYVLPVIWYVLEFWILRDYHFDLNKSRIMGQIRYTVTFHAAMVTANKFDI